MVTMTYSVSGTDATVSVESGEVRFNESPDDESKPSCVHGDRL